MHRTGIFICVAAFCGTLGLVACHVAQFQWHPMLYLLLYVFDALLLLLPGVVISLMIDRKTPLAPVEAVITSLAGCALLGYIAFWIYFANVAAGVCFSFAVMAGSMLGLGWVLRSSASRALARRIAEPLSYIVLGGVFYFSLFLLWGSGGITSKRLAFSTLDPGVTRFFDKLQTADNELPFMIAQRIYEHVPIKPFLPDWQSSDRPPLQSGIFLLSPARIFLSQSALHYQLVSTAAQCFWLCGAWALLDAMAASRKLQRRMMALLLCSGFLFYNSIYVWPKLLSAAMLLCAVAILVRVASQNRRAKVFELALAGTCVGAALVAHPGCIFSFPGILLLLLWKRKHFPVLRLGWTAATVLVFLLPWIAYQKLYDPPGDRLPRLHLAGDFRVHGPPLWQSLREAYHTRSWQTILQYRLSNLRLVIGPEPAKFMGITSLAWTPSPHVTRAGSDAERFAQQQYMWNAVGIFEIGWVFAAAALFIRKTPAMRWALCFLLVVIVNLILWSLILFNPGETVTTHGSFVDILFPSIALGILILSICPVLFVPLLIGQIFNIYFVWAWSGPQAPVSALGAIVEHAPLLAVGISCAVLMIWNPLRETAIAPGTPNTDAAPNLPGLLCN